MERVEEALRVEWVVEAKKVERVEVAKRVEWAVEANKKFTTISIWQASISRPD
jgi:hypothetical protein